MITIYEGISYYKSIRLKRTGSNDVIMEPKHPSDRA